MHRLLLATLVGVAACRTGLPAAASTREVTARPASSVITTPDAVLKARADSARLPYTAADVHFMSSMIGHHAQAIVMSRLAPTHGASSSVLTLASRIINAQQDEILMTQLRAAEGRDFDKLFLTDMIQHHRGAIQMVKELFAAPGAGQDELVFKFASDVNVDQTTEVSRMQQMLAAVTLGSSPL